MYKEVSEWLSYTGPDEAGGREYNLKRHEDYQEERFKNTCDWLLDELEFIEWLNGNSNLSVLWLKGSPGSGKSMLCSRAIAHIDSIESFPVSAFHFSQPSRQWTVLQTTKSIANQLFERYWSKHDSVPEHLYAAILKNRDEPKNVRDFLKLLVKEFSVAYIFIDGLDEDDPNGRAPEAVNMINILLDLANSCGNSIRIWFSSQDKHQIREELHKFPTIDVQNQVNKDVDNYLSQAVPLLHKAEIDDETSQWILKIVRYRVNGNFLFAKFMVRAIEDVGNFDDMKLFVQEGLPQSIDDFYEKAFSRYLPAQSSIVR